MNMPAIRFAKPRKNVMTLHKTPVAAFIGMALMTCFGACAAGSASSTARPWLNPRLSPDQRAALVLKAMTQDEKFQLISVQFGDTENGHIMSPGALGSAGYDPAITRLGLPALQESDAGLGVAKPLKLGATALPSGLATAATFDPALAHAGGAMIGSEAHAQRLQRAAGRRRRTWCATRATAATSNMRGEDPLLAGADRRQRDPRHPVQHVISTIKHYALNDQETGRRR